MRATCAAAAALKKANKGQPFFAQAQYFFSLDSRSAEMQGAVAALLAGIVTAVVAAARAPLRLVKEERSTKAVGAQWRLSKGLKGEPLKFARAFQSPSDCSSLAASFFTAASVVLRARTNTDRVTQISLEMVLLLVVLRCCTAAWQRRRRRRAAAALLPPPPMLLLSNLPMTNSLSLLPSSKALLL